MRVLVVENELYLAETLRFGLQREAMAVDTAMDGSGAMSKIAVYAYDVVILDRDLPGTQSDLICSYLATRVPHCRILMLGSASTLDDRIDALHLGADDYLTKPFEFRELVARTRALHRRSTPGLPPVLRCGDLRLDPGNREVYRGGRYIRLTRKEFAVLEVLMRGKGNVVSVEQLLEKAWDEHVDPFTNAVRITISTLRRKLGTPPLLKTVIGVGYCLVRGS